MSLPLRVVAIALALPAAAQGATAKSSKLEAAYVLIGAEGPLARAVSKDAKDCPKIVIDKTKKDMAVRARPQNGKDAAFPVLVCDYPIPAGTTSASIDGNKLPLPPSTLKSVAVLGDTGCRLKADKPASAQAADDDDDDDKPPAATSGKFQDCDKSSKWPFSQLAASLAGNKPQLVVHVGDYLYRESPCPKGDNGCKGSPYGDTWDAWKADFFKPAKALLAAAPWIATRGNHEICKRAGAGFMLLLDTSPGQNETPPACNDLLPAFTATVGAQAFVVLDSSNADDACASSGCASAPYAAQLAALTPANGTWFVSHRPIWGFKNKGEPINATLQAALTQWQGKLPPGFALALAGHIHIWEALSFADQRTPQFVLGNGGTMLTHAIKKPLTGRSVGGTTVSDGISVDKWGYTIFTQGKSAGQWTATYYSVKGNDKLTCKVSPTAVSC